MRASKITLILCGVDPYLLIYPSIHDLILKLVSLDIILTSDHVFSMNSRSRFFSVPILGQVMPDHDP